MMNLKHFQYLLLKRVWMPLLICSWIFGGDGTILRATTFVKDLGIPIVGVNTGRLGIFVHV